MSDDPIGRYFDEMMPKALKFFEGLDGSQFATAEWAQNAGDGTPTVKAGSFLVPPVNDLTVRKVVSYITVPDELLMDAGVIPDTRPPRPPLPWRWRMRNRVAGWRESLARRAYRIIAGYEVPDGYDG